MLSRGAHEACAAAALGAMVGIAKESARIRACEQGAEQEGNLTLG